MMAALLNKILFTISFCISFFIIEAQVIPLPVYEIKTDTLNWDAIDKSYYQLLEDKEGKLTIEQLTQLPLINNFHDSIKDIDNKVNTYWFRYSLKNTMDHKASICLNSMCDYDDFYVSGSNAKWDHYTTGNFVQWNKRDGLRAANCIPVIISPGEKITIYQRTKNTKPGLPEGFQIAILSTEKAIQQSYIDNVHDNTNRYSARELQEMFLEGVLLLAIFINMLFYRVVKEKEYLYFSLFLLF